MRMKLYESLGIYLWFRFVLWYDDVLFDEYTPSKLGSFQLHHLNLNSFQFTGNKDTMKRESDLMVTGFW